MLLSAFLLPSLICGTAFLINFIAMYYHASRAIPFGSMVAVTCICLFVILPLTLIGSVLGRNLAGQASHACRVNAVPRPIPEKKWYMEPLVITLMGGILPFGSIFIEMYFIFTSFWAYKIYYVFGFMLLVFFILSTVTVCVTIVCTYFLLNAEDYRWCASLPPLGSCSLSLSLTGSGPPSWQERRRLPTCTSTPFTTTSSRYVLQSTIVLTNVSCLADQDVRSVPDDLLLRTHGAVLCRLGTHVRDVCLPGDKSLRPQDLLDSQDRLAILLSLSPSLFLPLFRCCLRCVYKIEVTVTRVTCFYFRKSWVPFRDPVREFACYQLAPPEDSCDTGIGSTP